MPAIGKPLKMTIGVTGHRDLLPAEVPAIAQRVRDFFRTLAAQYPALQLELITGLADGADSLVAEVALELGLPVVAVLPVAQASYEQDFSTDNDANGDSPRARFRRLLGQSQVLTMPPPPGDEKGTADADTVRIRQYAQLGIFLSNHCQILLTLWDGKKTSDIGGTHSVTHYHLTGVMPGWEWADESPNLLADNENDLAYHVVCSRAGDSAGPDPRFRPLQTFWMTAHFGRQSPDTMPLDYAQMFQRLALFSSECTRHTLAIESAASSLLPGGCGTVAGSPASAGAPPAELPTGCAKIDALFQAADWLAVRYQRRFSRCLLLSHVLAVLMGLVFIVYSEMVEVSALAWLFFGLFGLGTVLHLVSEKREWHRKYLDYRALAEGLRVQVYWSLSGVVDAQKAEFAYDNFLQKQDVDLAWIRHVMRSASLQSFGAAVPDPAWVDWVATCWIGTADRPAGQLGYYESKALDRSITYRRTVLLGSVALWIGVSMAGFLGLFASSMSDPQVFALVIMMGVLPLIAGVRDAYSHKKADKELIKQYQFMTRIFSNARRLLDDTQDLQFKRRVLRAVGNAALEEHAEWLLMHRERPLERSGIQ